MKTYLLAVLFVVALVAPAWAQDADWGPWASLGNNVSVRISSKLMNGGVTWEFRNGGNVDITYMDYYYNDNAGKHEDWFPGTLRAGGIFGGWAAFGPSTGTPVSFQLKAVKLANASGGTSGNATGTGQSDTSSQQAALQQQIQQQQAAARERQQQLQQQIADKQAQLQAQQTAFEAKRQQALNNIAAKNNAYLAMGSAVQNAANQIADLLQRQEAEREAREAKQEWEEQQAEADREQRDLQNQIEQLKQQATDNQNNNQNIQNNYSPAPVQIAQPQVRQTTAPVKPTEPSFDDLLQQASRGDAVAENKLGIVYQNQRHDYMQAVNWYRKAAEQGNADAEYNLAVMYRGGWSVAKDMAQAKVWYQKAAVQGNQSAKYALSKLNQNSP